MTIRFKNTKENNVYEQYVTDPTDRAKLRAFTKKYSSQIAGEAVKLHQRLIAHPTAASYNKMFGATNNRIEIKRGTKENLPMYFKVRVTGSWRKFFHQLIGDSFVLGKEWVGDFESISDIYVYEINNHEYAAIH